MPRPSNHARDLEIFDRYKTDGEYAWTVRRIAAHYNMAPSSVHKAIERGRKLREGTRVRLSKSYPQ